MTKQAVESKVWVFAQPEATGSNGWAGKAIVAGLNVTSVDRGTAFYEDDARLIAAAPDLLAALQTLVEKVEEKWWREIKYAPVSIGQYLMAARAAIEKAQAPTQEGSKT